MSDTILVALISLSGNLIGSILAIFAANKLMNYRVDKIEENLKKIDAVEGRVYNLEKENAIQNERLAKLDEEQNRTINDIKEIKAGGAI